MAHLAQPKRKHGARAATPGSPAAKKATRRAEKASKLAQAVAFTVSGDKSEREIAEALQIGRRTLTRWKASPEFAQKMAQQGRELAKVETKAAARIRQAELSIGIADRVKRVQALHDRWERLRAGLECILDERAADMAGVPGGGSGLLTREWRRIGSGQGAEMKEQYRVDAGVLKLIEELREHEKQAAQELGQWVPDLPPERPGEDGYRLDELTLILRRIRARCGDGGDHGDGGSRIVDVGADSAE